MLSTRNQEQVFILNARSNRKPVQDIGHEDMIVAREMGSEFWLLSSRLTGVCPLDASIKRVAVINAAANKGMYNR